MTSERAELVEKLRDRAGHARREGNCTAQCDARMFDKAADYIESQAVAGEAVCHRLLRKNGYGDWVNDSKDWVDGLPPPELVRDVSKHPDLYKIEYAYAAPQPAPVDAAVLMNKETVRRVAKAIIAARTGHPESYVWKQLGSNERKFADEVARSAIAALTAKQQESTP